MQEIITASSMREVGSWFTVLAEQWQICENIPTGDWVGSVSSWTSNSIKITFCGLPFCPFTTHHGIHSVFVCCLLFYVVNPGSVSLTSIMCFFQRLTRCSPLRNGIWARCKTMAMRILLTNTWSRCRYKRDEDGVAPMGKVRGRGPKVVQCFGSATDQQLLQEDFILHSELLDH